MNTLLVSMPRYKRRMNKITFMVWFDFTKIKIHMSRSITPLLRDASALLPQYWFNLLLSPRKNSPLRPLTLRQILAQNLWSLKIHEPPLLRSIAPSCCCSALAWLHFLRFVDSAQKSQSCCVSAVATAQLHYPLSVLWREPLRDSNLVPAPLYQRPRISTFASVVSWRCLGVSALSLRPPVSVRPSIKYYWHPSNGAIATSIFD